MRKIEIFGGRDMAKIIQEITSATEKHTVSMMVEQIMKKIDNADSYEKKS